MKNLLTWFWAEYIYPLWEFLIPPNRESKADRRTVTDSKSDGPEGWLSNSLLSAQKFRCEGCGKILVVPDERYKGDEEVRAHQIIHGLVINITDGEATEGGL